MVRVPAALALISLMSVSLAACGSPETTAPAAEDTAAATSTPAADAGPVMPDDAPPQEEAGPEEGAPEAVVDCNAEIGETAAARLVERCIAVSPATRPPCNALNTCEAIQGEIDRSCAMYDPGEAKPAECAA